MNDVFKFEQQEEGERELVLLVGPRGPLPHQRYATHSDIKAALAEKELCVVPKGRHDWVFAEEVMKRDEEIARLTAALTAEQQRRQEVERDRDGWKRAAESQNRQWSKKCAQLTDVRAELTQVERELASCRNVVEAAKALVRRRFAAADDADGHGTTYRAHAAEWERLEQALAAVGKDSGEVNPPGIPESSNSSKSSNGSTSPAATVPRGEMEELLRRVAAIPCRCYLAPCLSCAAKSLLAKAEVKS